MRVIEYEGIRLMKQSDKSAVHLVREKDGGRLFVRKALRGRHEIYKTIENLSHPYLAQIYEVDLSEDATVVIEEYIEGSPIGEADLTEKAVCNAIKELCLVLEFLHSKGIVHRDIKPSNVLLANDGHIRLIDFDAARTMKEDAEQDTKLLGTEGYAPPEQYGFAQTDARADVYALGVTFEKLLVQRAGKQKYKRFIKKCTELNPDMRYQSAREARAALSFYQRRLACLSAVVAAVLLLCGALYMVSPDARAEEPIPIAEASTVSETEVATVPDNTESPDMISPDARAEEPIPIAEASAVSETEAATVPDNTESPDLTLPIPQSSGEPLKEGNPPRLGNNEWEFVLDGGGASGGSVKPGTGTYAGAVIESLTYKDTGEVYTTGFEYALADGQDGSDHFTIREVIRDIASEQNLNIGDVIELTANFSNNAGSADFRVTLIADGFHVAFDSNGAAPNAEGSAIVGVSFTREDGTLGENLNRPQPVRPGYFLVGWFTERTGGTKITVDTVFTEDTTIYAQWREITANP